VVEAEAWNDSWVTREPAGALLGARPIFAGLFVLVFDVTS